MPLQHGSNEMLKIMRRGITREKTEALIETIRDQMPNLSLRTTMIVGHPGEKEEDFEELMKFVEWARFDRLGVFPYSHEEQTHAYIMVDDVEPDVKEERAAELMALQQDISLELNEAKIGNTYKVLFDRKEGDYFIGRTEHDSPEVDNEVLVKAVGDTFVRLGDFANVKITSAEAFDLYGELVV
jgi:ribosomal protein S12 methylthiotransferase